MISISDILLPGQIQLSLKSKDQAGGVDELLATFRGDIRIHNYDSLVASVQERNAPAITCNQCGICIAHGRTNAVSSLVMAAGRSDSGLVSPEVREKVRLVFVAGIPRAFDSEYLRIVGFIARLCKDKRTLEHLLSVPDPEDFIQLLTSNEARV